MQECQEECARDLDCRSFSYRLTTRRLDFAGTSFGPEPISRYATFNSRTDNCLLSNIETPVQNVGHFYAVTPHPSNMIISQEMVSDSNWDVYNVARQCDGGSSTLDTIGEFYINNYA